MKQLFLDAGYKEYNELSKNFLQKCVYDGLGKRYFINLNVNDYRQLKAKLDNFTLPDFSYSADVQFKTQNDETFNVNLLDVKSVKQVENFFETIFNGLYLTHYDD